MTNSLDACIKATAGELGLEERDVREIADRLKRKRQQLTADGQITRADETLRQHATSEAEKVRVAAALKRKQAALNILLRDEWDRDLGEMMGQGLDAREAVLAKLVGSVQGVTKARKSVSARRAALEADWLGGLVNDVSKELPHILPLLRKPRQAKALMDDVVREMRELRPDGTPGVTKNADAQALAKILAKYGEASRLELNRAGAAIGKLDGWSPQSHDATKLLRVGQEAWVREVLPLIDVQRSFPDVEPDKLPGILGEVYLNIVTGQDRTLTAKRKGERTGPANLARSLEKHRVLHFKDADAWIGYSDRFGRGNVVTAMVDHLHMAARKASLMQVMGPNPQVFLDGVLEKLKADVRSGAKGDPAKAAKALERLNVDLDSPVTSRIGKAFAEVSGETLAPVSLSWARAMSGIRAVESMAKLGGAVISSVTDLVTYAHGMRFQGKGMLQGYADAFTALFGGRQPEEQRQLARMLSVGFDTILGDIHSRYSAEDQIAGTMTRAMNAFFKASGLTWWTDRLTNAFARMSSAWMAEHAGKGWDALDPSYRHVLNIHGIDAQRWEIARQALHVAEDGESYIVPEKVRELPDEAFAGLGKSVDRARRELELDLRAFFADEAAFGVVKADDRARMFAVQGTRPGTALGEAIRFIMQFKSFPIAYTQKVLGRTLRGGEGRKVDKAGLAQLIAMSWVFGYAAMTAKDAIKNRSPRDPTRWETIMAALIQGGGAGIYGDFLFAKRDRFGGGIAGDLIGPSAGTAVSTLEMWQDIMHGDAKAGDAFYLFLNNFPGANLWYGRAAFDLMVLNDIQEWISPGTLKRREKRLEKDFGQQYILQP